MSADPAQEPARLETGLAALARGAWEEAAEALRAAADASPHDGGPLEALGAACMWLDDMDAAIRARQDAYALYRESGDDLAAARVALDLAYDFIEVRGELAVGNGWIQRGRRLLEGRPRSRELALLRIWDAYLGFDDDPERAEGLARETAEISREVGAHDVEVLALALEGAAAVTLGRVARGMSLLDEAVAAAIGRELPDPQWFYFACCCMIDACDQVRDYERSLEWCHRLREFSTRWRVRAFLTACRVKYTGALHWQGAWSACEAELERAIEELSDPPRPARRGAQVRLAELRWRQGRKAESRRLLDEAGELPDSEVLRATMALEEGDPATATDRVEAILRRAPSSASALRVPALELGTLAYLALRDLDRAAVCAEELGRIAEAAGTKALRAAAFGAAGRIAAARDEPERARELLADAAHLADDSGSPYEAARLRLALARVLAALDRLPAAMQEASRAAIHFERLGAAADAARTRELLARLEARTRAINGSPKPRRGGRALLTRRQREILGLVARGLSDREIAERLFLSEHTVHRHVANVLARLGVTSRAAAVAQAVRSDLI